MAVQYSTQSVISDGTLSTVVLGIKYILRANIYLRVGGVDTPQTGAPSGYTWSFLDATTIKILPVVPTGVTVEVYRRTDITGMYNVYSQNAQFDEGTVDENNTQLLYIAQEYLEQDLTGVGIAALEYVRSEPGYETYRFQRSDGTYLPEFPVPTDTAALETHKASTDQHPISGVSGLTVSLQTINNTLGQHTSSITSLNASVTSLDSRTTAIENELSQVRSTCLVNALGTGAPHETVVAQLPATVAPSTRIVIPNPFGANTPVRVEVQAFLNNKWGPTGYIFTNNSLGITGGWVQGEGIIIVAGAFTATASASSGGVHNYTGGNITTPLPVRVFVSKL